MKCPKCQSDNPERSRFCADCGTQLGASGEKPVEPIKPIEHTKTLQVAKQELTTGSTFAGKYQIIEEIGKGGMGRVYKAQDTEIREKVALKLIKSEIAADEKTIERFRNELKFTRKIRHKNVCQMYDLNREEGTYYITMEYVSGEDLKSLIRKMGHLSSGQAITIAKQTCDGLEEAHKAGVVHRDLKPSNIMIDKDGQARIMDFGIARSLRGKGITGAGVMIGTPEYMSPEQVEGKEVDQRSDIYSLGVILYEMLTGRVPFEGDTPFTVGVKHKSERPQDPREYNAQIPENFSNVILKCLEKDKENRYQDAGDIRSELEKIEQGISTTERAVPKRTPLTSREITVQFSLKKVLMPALILIAIVVAGFILWQLFLKKETTPLSSGKPSLAVINFDNRSDEPYLDKMIADMLVSNLSRTDEIEVVSSLRLYDILKELGKKDVEAVDASLATEVANRTGAETMLSGSINKVGEKIRIISQLTDVKSGKIIASPQVEGEGPDEIFQMADSLAELIAIELGVLTEAEKQAFKISDVTTDSIEAYKHYQKGLDDLWMWRFDVAEEAFRKAIEIDPSFTMAYYNLAWAMLRNGAALTSYATDLRPAREVLDQAKKYVHKVSDRERLLIDAASAAFDWNTVRFRTICEDLVERYPKSKDAYWLLAYSGVLGDDIQVAIEAFEKLLEIDPTFREAYNMLAYCYVWFKDYPAAISTIKKYKALHPTHWNSYHSFWEIYCASGEFDEAIRVCNEALINIPDWNYPHWLMGLTYLFKGSAERARAKLQEYVNMAKLSPYYKSRNFLYSYIAEGRFRDAYDEAQRMLALAQDEERPGRIITSRMFLGRILVELGRYDEAVNEYSEVETLSQKNPPSSGVNTSPLVTRYYKGIAFVRKGDYEKAVSLAEEIKQLTQKEEYMPLHLDYYYQLMGDIYITQRKPDKARTVLDKFSTLGKNWSGHTNRMRALILEGDGNYTEAIEGYKGFYGNTFLLLYVMRDYFLFWRERFRVDYNIARLYEKMGDREKAEEHYEKFLELAKNADEGLVEVEDAKKRLASLKNE